MRSSGGNAAPLAGIQDQGTAVNKLSVSSSTKRTANSSSSVSGTLKGRLEVAGHGTYSGKQVYWGSPGSRNGLTITNGATADKGVHHVYPIVSGSLSGSSSGGTWSTSSSISSTDAETRPVNITVNTFIRIN